MANLILITGNSSTGKSTISPYIVELSGYPLFSKDGIKEPLLDELGWSDVEWSTKVGAASVNLLLVILEQCLSKNVSSIIEANFRYDRDRERLAAIVAKYPARIIEVHCTATPEVMFQRYKDRALSGERHLGHSDASNFEEMEKRFFQEDSYRALRLGELIEADTTNGLDWKSIEQKLKSLLGR